MAFWRYCDRFQLSFLTYNPRTIRRDRYAMRPQILATGVFIAVFVSTAAAQTEQQIEPSETQTETQIETPPPKYRLMDASFDILRDEKTIWKDMFRIRRNEMKWIVPIAAANAVAFSTDAAAFQEART